MPAPPHRSLIVLTGFMGSGKSSVGHALAALLNWHFVDLDFEIENAEKRKIREIFREDGEPHFREIETNVLRSVLRDSQRPIVLASGGGTYVQAGNAELLRAAQATVIFLEASTETLLQRCCSGRADPSEAIRPLARDRDAFVRLYEERLPFYRTADLTVNSDNKPPEAVAQEIAKKLQLLAGG